MRAAQFWVRVAMGDVNQKMLGITGLNDVHDVGIYEKLIMHMSIVIYRDKFDTCCYLC